MNRASPHLPVIVDAGQRRSAHPAGVRALQVLEVVHKVRIGVLRGRTRARVFAVRPLVQEGVCAVVEAEPVGADGDAKVRGGPEATLQQPLLVLAVEADQVAIVHALALCFCVGKAAGCAVVEVAAAARGWVGAENGVVVVGQACWGPETVSARSRAAGFAMYSVGERIGIRMPGAYTAGQAARVVAAFDCRRKGSVASRRCTGRSWSLGTGTSRTAGPASHSGQRARAIH